MAEYEDLIATHTFSLILLSTSVGPLYMEPMKENTPKTISPINTFTSLCGHCTGDSDRGHRLRNRKEILVCFRNENPSVENNALTSPFHFSNRIIIFDCETRR